MMLLAKYRKMEDLHLEAYYLSQMHEQIPVHIVVELESRHKKSNARREIHQGAIAKFATKILSINELVEFNEELMQLIHRFNLYKTKYYKQVVDAVYFETVTEAINDGQNLPNTTRAYYGKNLLFKYLPSFGIGLA